MKTEFEILMDAIGVAQEVKNRIAVEYQNRLDTDTSRMDGNMDWARLEGAVKVIDALQQQAKKVATVSGWKPIESAPTDGTPILVYYDHDADPYYMPPMEIEALFTKNEQTLDTVDNLLSSCATDRRTNQILTTYAAHYEGLNCLRGSGFCIAVFGGEYWEDASGEGWGPHIYIPPWWFVNDGYFETAVNPIYWLAIPEVPQRLLDVIKHPHEEEENKE